MQLVSVLCIPVNIIPTSLSFFKSFVLVLIILLTAALNDNVDVRCFGDIPPNNWTLLACDGKGNNPAVDLTDINIPLILPSSIGKAMFVDDHYKFNVFI